MTLYYPVKIRKLSLKLIRISVSKNRWPRKFLEVS